MNSSCINKKYFKERISNLQKKYNASEDSLDHAIYSWASINKEKTKEGIDLDSTELEDYLDSYFKITSGNIITNKKVYENKLISYNSIKRELFDTRKEATKRYNEYVRVFGEENVVMYQTPDGSYIARAAKPIFKKKQSSNTKKTQWARTATNSYEVSSQGDKRFSALNAKFKKGTVIEGVDVSGMTIEDVYQNIIKKSGKGKSPSADSILNINRISDWDVRKYVEIKETLPKKLKKKIVARFHNNKLFEDAAKEPLTKEELEDFSYYVGYLPLWQEWAEQNPELMRELREKSAGKVLTDKFASTRVSQARALAEILNIASVIEEALTKEVSSSQSDSSSNTEEDKVTEAEDKLKEVREEFESKIKFDKDSHTYTVYDSAEDKKNDTNGHKAISVTQYIYGKVDLGAWETPSDAIGNTNDVIIRDFFSNNLKKSYPNMNARQLKNFIEDLEKLREYFEDVHGKNCRVITDEFPIAGKYTVMVKGKPVTKYMAGTMDMIVIDEDGKYWGYDMKAKRSGVKESDKVNYGNQLGLYSSIFKPYGITFEGTKLIHSEVYYDGPIDAKYGAGDAVYTVDNKGQLYDNGKKIQSVRGYSAPRLSLNEGEIGSSTIIPVKLDKKNKEMTIEMQLLPKEDKELAEEEFGSEPLNKPTTQASSITYKGRKIAAKSGLFNPILPASARKFLASQVMQNVSLIITHLQTDPLANTGAENSYFEDGRYEDVDFTSMSREEIIDFIGINNLLKKVKEVTIERALLEAADENIQMQLEVAYDYFDDLVNEGYSKLITLEGVTVQRVQDTIIEDTGDDNIVDDNDAGSLEEKEREYWQLGQRQISAKSSLSKEIRRMFERLKVIDKEGNSVKDEFGFGLDTFVDANTAVNSILTWCQDCTTIEEMETILKEKSESTPYLNTILEKIKEEPIRSLFFKNFRKDFTVYSVIRAETDSEGKKTYVVHQINTKGAGETVLKNLTTSFRIGAMQNLIITKDDVEGKGRVNVKKVEAIRDDINKIVSNLNKAFGNEARYKKALKREAPHIAGVLNKLGINVMPKTILASTSNDSKSSNFSTTNSGVLLNKAGYIVRTLLDYKDLRNYNPMLKEQTEGNTFNTYRDIVGVLERDIEDSIEASVYENGKMYYSFVTPSYMGKLITNLKNAIQDSKKFETFIKENYKSYRWFYDKKAPDGKKWSNPWLEMLNGNKDARGALEHKVQLNFGKTPYNELSELGYTLSLMHEYFYNSKNKDLAWFRLPILANKPSSEFVRFYKFTGKNYKQTIKQGLKNVFNQEILRIQTVFERAALADKSGVEKIGAYDIDLKLLKSYLNDSKKYDSLMKRIKTKKITIKDLEDIRRASASKGIHSGAEFRFLEILNNEINHKSELAQMIVDKLNDKNVNEDKLDLTLIGSQEGKKEDGVFDAYMKQIVEKEFAQWESIGLFDSDESTTTDKKGKTITKTEYKYVSQFGKNPEEIYKNLENYIWNDMFATINIIQLTATDLAYYKNMEDFQKRYAQVHAPALKLNTTAEYKGVRVSDGKARTVYIRDNEVVSEIIPNVKEIFDRKLASIEDKNKKAEMKKMVDLILSGFEKINVTDAQGYSSPTAYRKKMIMAGTWDEAMEKAYERIRSGNYDVNDLGVVWQPLKPFVYSQIRKTTGVSKMSEIKVPVQNKNSEYMLLLADALMRGANKKSTLGAIFDFMEESHLERDEKGNPIKGTYRQDGIDTVQFESAVKSGLMGVVDINNMSYKDVKDTLESKAYYSSDKQASEDNNMDRYNDQFVHTIPFEDYGIQQEVPQHLIDHHQAMGSQVRILSISDISSDATFKVGNSSRVWDRDALINRYQELHATNIKESFDKLSEELSLTDEKGREITDRKLRNKALSKLLVDAIKKDQRYGADLLRACSLDENDEFIIPPNDPIQSQRIQQLINSIIKSRINKQEVLGGPVVQASVFGMSDDLHIVFNDKDGNPMIPRSQKAKESKEEYQKYLNKFYTEVSKNQGSLAYMEVYMPIPSEELEKALTKKDGTIMDVEEAVKKRIIPEEMLKAIGYRIPTEDKYSMIPMKIKGFLPKAAGEALMMPKEITLLTGSDFDKHQC